MAIVSKLCRSMPRGQSDGYEWKKNKKIIFLEKEREKVAKKYGRWISHAAPIHIILSLETMRIKFLSF